MPYHQVDTEFWADTIEWTPDERDLAIYLLTCEYRNQEGLFRIRPAQIALDRGWAPDRVTAALNALSVRGWALHDQGWMLLRNSLRWAPPKGAKQVAGAANKVKTVPRDSRLWTEFCAAAERFCPDLALKLRETTNTPPRTSNRVSAAEEGVSPSTPLHSTQTPLHSSADNGAPNSDNSAAAAVSTDIVQALKAAGYDQLTIEQNTGGITQALGEFQIPADVDWWRTGQEIRRLREAGTLRSPKPDSGIRFIARSMTGFPRLGTGTTPPPSMEGKDRPSWDEIRDWLNRKVDTSVPPLRWFKDTYAANPPAAHLIARVGLKAWDSHEPGSFEGRQWLKDAERKYHAMSLEDLEPVREMWAMFERNAKISLFNEVRGNDPQLYGLDPEDLEDVA